ncbi:MAG: HAD-IC family P-type ATPase [Clostridia bacterium]|nr:HAD-IC family P-type ATPase [Clostridia bacterium]
MKKEKNTEDVDGNQKKNVAHPPSKVTNEKPSAPKKNKPGAKKKNEPKIPKTDDLLATEEEFLTDPDEQLLAELDNQGPPTEEDEDEDLPIEKEEPTPPPQPEKKEEPAKAPSADEKEKPEKKWWHFFRRKQKEPVDPLAGIERFEAKPDKGLTQEQVNTRNSQGLVNSAPPKYSKTYKSIFFGNICSVFNLLCIICAVALALAHAPYTQYFFVLIFLCNITISIIQEIRAKRMIDKLSILSSSTAKVLRGGEPLDLPVDQIVIDDVLILSAGQQVPADCTVISGNAEFNEALLTGESVAIKKHKGDELFAGSFVASGQVAARVEKVGDFTYISKLTAKAKKYKRPNSEIMNSINLFIKIIGIAIIPIAILMFLNNFRASPIGEWSNLAETGGFWKTLFAEHSDGTLSQVIQKTVAVVIGMIPSGLLLLTTVALSVGIIRLTKYKTLVQDMYSLEMLARVNVLCLDKTGTITDGRMKVNGCEVLENKSKHSVEEIVGSMLAALNDNNQTSIALFEHFGHSNKLHPLDHLPFSSARKYSAVHFHGEGTYVLGAPEFVLDPLPINVDKLVKQYAQLGLRVLLVAHSKYEIRNERAPDGLTPVALITLTDNIRPDAIETIKWFHENDVDVKVISGDNPITVSEVARRAGIKNAAKYISLEGLSVPEVETAATQYTVFGRVTPEQKAILIRAIKNAGNTVAMTGDGVNDILAMKEADCAISVASGSEAARNIANLVLQDNNFASMPQIVNEGRRVINNIKNSASLYIMKTLLTLFLAAICIFSKSQYFFTTQNMMMYEFLVSAIPSFVLSLQPNTNRVKGKFIPYVLSRAMPGALTMALGILTIFVIYQLTTVGVPDVFHFVNPETGALTLEYNAIMVLALTFAGLVMLYQVCRPFNPIRATLFVVCAALSVLVVCVPHLGNLFIMKSDAGANWSAVNFSLPQILLLIIIVQAAFPISSFLIKVFDMMNPKNDEKEEKEETTQASNATT